MIELQTYLLDPPSNVSSFLAIHKAKQEEFHRITDDGRRKQTHTFPLL